MTPEQHIWACALAVERQHGAQAAAFAEQRIAALRAQGDAAGARMWEAIAERLDALSQATPARRS